VKRAVLEASNKINMSHFTILVQGHNSQGESGRCACSVLRFFNLVFRAIVSLSFVVLYFYKKVLSRSYQNNKVPKLNIYINQSLTEERDT
jgi:hypothetical protein